MRPPSVGEPPPRLADARAEERYQAVLERWTRRAEIYEGFDSRVFFAATLQSREFREARIERLAAFRGLSQDQTEPLLATERKEHAEAVEFVLGVHANERRFDDFSRPDSMWQVSLSSAAGVVLPLSIEKLRRPDVNMRAIYPFLEPFWTGYRVRFPPAAAGGAPMLSPESGQVALRFASAVGRAQMIFPAEAR